MYVLPVGFVPSAFVFLCICNICCFFFTLEPTLVETTFPFQTWPRLSLSSVNCSRIKWNSCPRILVCADLISAWVLFWTCYDIAHNKEREQCAPLFHIVFCEFLNRRLESKGKKVVNCTHTLLPRKTSWKGTEKWKL